MTHTPQDGGPFMTLPNGETIREGEYGVTRDGQKVGPMKLAPGCEMIFMAEGGPDDEHWTLRGFRGHFSRGALPDIIAKWHPVEAGHDPKAPPKPPKRDLRTIDEPFGELDERTQKRLRKADAKGFPLQTKGLTPDGSTGSEWGPISKNGWYREETVRLDPTFTPPVKRIKLAPVVETITQNMIQGDDGLLFEPDACEGTVFSITFTRTNGVIDNDSYKVEAKG